LDVGNAGISAASSEILALSIVPLAIELAFNLLIAIS
jgi:hypothetical protein